MGKAQVEVVGELHLEGREGPEGSVLRGSLSFDDGEITLVVRVPKLTYEFTGIAPGSVVRVTGRLVQHRWTTGNGRRVAEIQLQPDGVTVIEDARKRGRLGA